MKDYIRACTARRRVRWTPAIVAKVLGDDEPLAADVRPGSLVTTHVRGGRPPRSATSRSSEEDVLMYALFPNEARNYLTLHQEGAEKAVFMMSEEINTVREEDVRGRQPDPRARSRSSRCPT